MNDPLATRSALVGWALSLALHALALAQGESFADEDRDWGVAPPPGLRGSNYHGRTPATLPGGRVIRTMELKAMLDAKDPSYKD